MRKFFLSLFSAIALLAVSCSEPYDDSALSGRIDSLESRVAQLEELCRQMNTNITSLQTIVEALQNNDYVTGVTPVTENGKTIGYTITFTKAQSITIYHGEDGQDGQDGHPPVVGVAKDNDGIYYWTIDEEWLLDENGKKVKVQGVDGKDGADGITPQLKIEEGYWYVSYDNGTTWKELGKATGEDGQNGTNSSDFVFQSIDTSNSDYVIFTLADGTELAVPRFKNLSIAFDIADDTACMPSASIKVGYTLTGADEGTTIETVGDGGWKSVVTKTDASSGYITVTAPASGGDGKVVMLATTSTGFSAMKAICFEEGVMTGIEDAYQVGYEESTVKVTLKTNLAYTVSIPNDATSWISVADTRAEMRSETLTFTIKENPEDSAARSATIKLIGEYDDVLQSFVIMQEMQPAGDPIVFANVYAKMVCVNKFDTNGDGELSYKEAAAVTSIETNFFGMYTPAVTSFDELQYFTSLERIEVAAFRGCGLLGSIIIPEGVTYIGSSAFAGCTSLKGSIVIPEGVTLIDSSLFNNCTSLESVTIPDSAVKFESSAFEGCTSLTAFYGKYATEDNRCWIVDGLLTYFAMGGVTTYTIPNSATTIGRDVFFRCPSLESITIPNSVTYIDYHGFYDCPLLTNIIIPNSVTAFAEQAIAYCVALESITIPESVISLGAGALEYSYALTTVYCKSETPPALGNDRVFNGAPLSKIYVPMASVNAYKASPYWGVFADKIEGYDFSN